jgi:hypothetical protein
MSSINSKDRRRFRTLLQSGPVSNLVSREVGPQVARQLLGKGANWVLSVTSAVADSGTG